MQNNWINYKTGFLATFSDSAKSLKSNVEVFISDKKDLDIVNFICVSANHDLVDELIKNNYLDSKQIDQINKIKNLSTSKRLFTKSKH
nr:hypothetical protein [Mycoplasmopsis bovis]